MEMVYESIPKRNNFHLFSISYIIPFKINQLPIVYYEVYDCSHENPIFLMIYSFCFMNFWFKILSKFMVIAGTSDLIIFRGNIFILKFSFATTTLSASTFQITWKQCAELNLIANFFPK